MRRDKPEPNLPIRRGPPLILLILIVVEGRLRASRFSFALHERRKTGGHLLYGQNNEQFRKHHRDMDRQLTGHVFKFNLYINFDNV